MDLKIDGTVYKLTSHARYRMNKRKVSINDLIEALENIKKVREHVKEGYETRKLITGRNNVSIVLTLENVIVTVYPFTKQYCKSKRKNQFNKKRRQLKKIYGNRFKY